MTEKMSLDDIYKRLNEFNITDNDERQFVIELRNTIPAHEIATVIGYLSRGKGKDFIIKEILPIVEHIEVDKSLKQQEEEIEK